VWNDPGPFVPRPAEAGASVSSVEMAASQPRPKRLPASDLKEFPSRPWFIYKVSGQNCQIINNSMKTLRDYVLIIENATSEPVSENSWPEFYEESKITQDDMMQVYDGVYFMASKERMYSLGAALVNTLEGNLDFEKNDRVKYFNQVIYPNWEKHKFPIPGKAPYGPFRTKSRACGVV
jgi:hypothetical protein